MGISKSSHHGDKSSNVPCPVLRSFYFFSRWLHAIAKEEKWLPAIMDPGKLMFIHTELTLVLVSGLEADMLKRPLIRENLNVIQTSVPGG